MSPLSTNDPLFLISYPHDDLTALLVNVCPFSQLINCYLDKIGVPTDLHRKNLDAEKGVKQKQIIRKSGEHAFVLNHLKSNACSPNF